MIPAALDDWDKPLSPAERETLLGKIADAIRKRGLQTPALFALEMHRPLGFVASQGILGLIPTLGPLLGLERMKQAGRLLADPAAIEALILRLEDQRTENGKEAAS